MFSYKLAMSGFAAMLTEKEVEDISNKDGFLHAHLSENYELDTTHSPSFLGLLKPPIGSSNNNNVWRDTFGYGKGVIIGVLDTGIPSNHPSFDDYGMPPPLKKSKNIFCQAPIVCNNKLIGAKSFVFYPNGTRETPIDEDGHGSHVAGTASGQFVNNASVLESAKGTASGVAPGSHLVIYKVCNREGCPIASIVAGMEDAIKDGVDVISLSISYRQLVNALYNNEIAIASFHAVSKGIFVSASAGNLGPEPSSLRNASPWIFTVGASTIDRKIPVVVKIGNGLNFQGESAYQPTNFTSSFLPMVLPQSKTDKNSKYCYNANTLKSIDVKGKIVVCLSFKHISRRDAGSNVKAAGGVAMIYIGGFRTTPYADVIPTSGILSKDRKEIRNYIIKIPNPKATLEFLGTKIGENSAPVVARFSSRGPSKLTPGFVKPDIIGPGVNILAAWHKSVGAFDVTPAFNIISGTSMSCPHLSGVAALLKSSHPDWSPAMIKSAIITTSDVTNKDGQKITDYDNKIANFHVMGSGHVNPIKANNPGLVYDIQPTNNDYAAYLYGLRYTDKQVSMFIPHSTRTTINNTIEGIDLNYPSMVVELTPSNRYHRRFSRVVTNVGPNHKYSVHVTSPHGVDVNVNPKTLNFHSIGQKLKFTVDVHLESSEHSFFPEGFGNLIWVSSDGKITVRSPLVISKK